MSSNFDSSTNCLLAPSNDRLQMCQKLTYLENICFYLCIHWWVGANTLLLLTPCVVSSCVMRSYVLCESSFLSRLSDLARALYRLVRSPTERTVSPDPPSKRRCVRISGVVFVAASFSPPFTPDSYFPVRQPLWAKRRKKRSYELQREWIKWRRRKTG